MLWIATIVLVLAVFFAYQFGFKRGASWAAPALVVCVVALLAVAVARLATLRHPSELQRSKGGLAIPVVATADAELRSAAEMMGQGLKGQLKSGAKVFIFVGMAEFKNNKAEQLKKWVEGGLGGATLDVVGSGIPPGGPPPSLQEPPPPAMGFALALGDKGDKAFGLDAVLSFIGLPDDWDSMPIYQLPTGKLPKVAAYFGSVGNMQKIKEQLEGGLIQAAVVKKDGQMELYTPERMP